MYKSEPQFPRAKVEQIRTGGVSLIGDSGIKSGIGKSAVTGPVLIRLGGLEGDAQAETFHGGGERAVLHYDRAHYAAWRKELPGDVDRFKAGAFGENLVTSGLSERDICLGDKVEVGGALLEVALFRQPCFKLNHQFHTEDMSRRAQQTGRTGWFYRVLQEGVAQAGDMLRVVERPLPEWTISRLQHFIYDAADDLDMAKELLTLTQLGQELRAMLEKRLATQTVESWDGRLSNGPLAQRPTKWLELELVEAEMLTPTVRKLRFEHPTGGNLRNYEAGAHIDLKAENALTRSYSLTTLPDGRGYELAVKREEHSRGGSAWVHDQLQVGDRVMVSGPQNFFELQKDAAGYLLIAGGIGITPLRAMIAQLEADCADWTLHYCAQSAENAPFADELRIAYPDRVHLHFDGADPAAQLDVAALLRAIKPDTHVYCCGPKGLMQAVQTASAHWPAGHVHFEAFSGTQQQPDAQNEPFKARIRSTGAVIDVDAQVSLLAALRDAGVAVDSQCEAGTCGACMVGYSEGEVEHRDFVLTPQQRASKLMCCVSRGKGLLELDL